MVNYYRGCYIKQGWAPLNEQIMKHLNWFERWWWEPPLVLWGWFSHDEGSGGTIIDYSPFAVNGYISGTPGATPEQLQAIFWATPGFGHSQGTGYPRVQTSRITSAMLLNYVSGVFFVRPLNYIQDATNRACMVGEGGNANWTVWGWENVTPTHWAMMSPNLDPSTKISSTLVDFNDWHCVYFVAAPYTGYEYQMWIRKSKGQFIKIIDAVHQFNYTGYGHAIYNFGPTFQGCSMDGGDFLIFVGETASEGIITLSDANNIYRYFKSRYDMK